jgi:hypothetical protein
MRSNNAMGKIGKNRGKKALLPTWVKIGLCRPIITYGNRPLFQQRQLPHLLPMIGGKIFNASGAV